MPSHLVRRGRGTPRTVAAAGLLLLVLLFGCAGPGGHAAARPVSAPASFASVYVENGQLARAARAYWIGARLAGARPWILPDRRIPASRTAGIRRGALRVGALFSRGPGGDHFCTASVVGSPSHDMLITAAHCVHGGRGKTYRSDIVFVPGYRDGGAPRGVWVPRKMLVASGWARSSDPARDVAFIVLQPLYGENIESVLGANTLGINQGYSHLVRVTGYPANGQQPITCVNRTSRWSRHQMRFACQGYSPGTSGSPWVTRYHAATHTGMIIGVIGGYQQGGNTADISYSPYFDNSVRRLYDVAAR